MISGGAIALLVLVAGLIYSKSSEHHQGPTARKSSAADEIEALRAELNEVKRNTAAGLMLARAANERSPGPSPGSAASAAPAVSPTPERSEEEKAADARRAELELAESLDRKFATEQIDRDWAGPAAEEAKRALTSQIDGDSSVRRVECRATWCRIETFHATIDAFRGFAKEALLGRQRQLWNGAITATVRDESESGVTAVTFISREGHPMPLPDGVEPTITSAIGSR